MSIIQEALRRKAEEQSGAAGDRPPSVVRPAPRPAARPTPRRRDREPGVPWLARGLFILLVLVVLSAVGYGVASSRWPRPDPRQDVTDEMSGAGMSVLPEPAPETSASSPVGVRPSEAPATRAPEEPTAAPLEPADSPTAGDAAEPEEPAPLEVVAASPPPADVAVASPEAPTAPWPALVVQGIVLRRSPQPSIALINGRRLRVGDVVEGVRLVAIEEEQVRLQYRGSERALRIGDVWE